MSILIGLTMMLAGQSPIPPSGPINASYHPQRIAKILPDLSKVLGITLRVDSSLAEDVVLIDVDHADSQVLLDKLASVLYAKWEPQDKGLILEPDKTRLAQAKGREWRDRSSKIRSAIERTQSTVKDIETNAIALLMSSIGSDRLAATELGTRQVFALHPNPRQLLLPAGAAEILKNLAMAVAAQKENGVVPDPRRPDLQLGQAYLAMYIDHDQVSTTLVVGNTDRMTLASGRSEFKLYPQPRPPEPKGAPITLSALAKEFASRALWLSPAGVSQPPTTIAISATREGRPSVRWNASSLDSIERNPKISTILQGGISDPLHADPFWVLAAPLEMLGSWRRSNLVACLPDYAFGPLLTSLATQSMDEAGLLRTALPDAGLDVDDSGGWVSISPSEPLYAIRSHIDRRALAELVAAARVNNVLSLDDLAGYAMAQKHPLVPDSIDDLYLRALNGQVWSKAVFCLRFDPEWARVYATLTPMQKSALAAHRFLGWSDLTPDQQGWLEFTYYNSRNSPSRQDPINPSSQFVGYDLDLSAERTELLSNGIPPTMRLTATFEQEPAYWGTDSKSGVSSVLTADRMASQLFQKTRSDFSFLGKLPTYDSFVPALSQSVLLRLEPTPEVVATKQLEGSAIDLTAKSRRLEDLSDVFRADVDQRLATLEGTLGSARLGQRKATPPP